MALWILAIEGFLFLLILWVAVRKPDSQWKEEKDFREELLAFHNEANMALKVRNELTREIIGAIREGKYGKG